MTEFEEETRRRLFAFIKKATVNPAPYSVQLHWHDVLTVPLTVLLHCPITSMTRTPSY